MSVLIKGMKTPGTCAVCEWSSLSYPNAWCRLKKKKTTLEIATTQRAAFCPLIEVQPHGRLIDADVLIEAMMQIIGEQASYKAWALLDTARKQPTIIEVEGSDT